MHGKTGSEFRLVVAFGGFVLLGTHHGLAESLAPMPMTEHQYACGYNGMDLQDLHDCGVTLLSHFPWSTDMEEMRRYIEKAHRLGIRLLPYISGEKAWYLDTPQRLHVFNKRSPAAAVPYYQAVDPSAHPQWILIDELGRLTPRYGSYVKNASGQWEVRWGVWHAHGQRYEDLENLRPWSWYMCSSVEDYLDAVEAGVRAVMDLGFDGVFLDNTYRERLPECHGAELNKHQHRAAGHNTDTTYVELARRVYLTVKSYGPGKIVLLNDGTQDVYAPIRDGAMIESYINAFAKRDDPDHWKKILGWAHDFQDEAEHGRFLTALSYLGSSDHPAKDDCFYTYACAGLSGFKWTATTPRPDVARLLYRARLIVPRGKLQEKDGLWYRAYDRGLVALNPDRKSESEAWLPLPASMRTPVELYGGRQLQVKNGRFHMRVDRQAGRVVVDLHHALDGYMAECAAALAGASKQLGGASDLTSTLAGKEKRLLGIVEQDLSTLPPLAEGTWQSAGPMIRKWSARLKGLNQIGSKDWDAPQREQVVQVLTDVHRWCQEIPSGNHRVIQCLKAAEEHAGRAATLVVGHQHPSAPGPASSEAGAQ